MSEWNTDFEKIPEGERVIVQYNDGHQYLMRPPIVDVGSFVAWHPMPEPYIPPKPEQVSPDDPLFPYTEPEELIRQIEQRTREIVAWEQKYEVKK